MTTTQPGMIRQPNDQYYMAPPSFNTALRNQQPAASSPSQQYSAGSRPYTAVASLSEEQAQGAIAQFGSPFATNTEWRPSQTLEPNLSKLPTLGITLRIKQRFARTAGDIWNPPSPSFQRGIPRGIVQNSFTPIRCKGAGELASNGFENVFPGAIMGAHDVSAADWHRFLQDLEVAGRLSGGQGVIANVAPLTMHMGLTGYFVTKAIQKGMARKKEPVVYETLEEWEQRFFIPRGLDVYICNKDARLTATTVGGQIDSLPVAALRPQDFAPDTSDNSDDSKDKHQHEKKKDREKREKKEKEQAKKEKKDKKDKDKKDKDKKSNLVLVIAPARHSY